MPDEGATDAHQRFANDLRRIRESYGLSVEDLHQSTKVPRGLIEEFEDNALVGHPMFNQVYLRSLARAYAGQLDLSPRFTLRALDRAQAGEYEGELADEYLEPVSSATEEEPDQEEEELETTSEEEEASTPEAALSEMTQEGEEELAGEPSPEREEEEQHTAGAGAAGTAAADAAATPEREEEAAAKRQASERSQRGGARSQRRRRRSEGTPNWVYGAGFIVILAVGIGLFLLFSGDGGEAGEQQVSEAIAEDTSSQAAEQPSAAPTEPVQIGDSLDFTVVAARGPVRELRVKSDDDLRRPYWIEEGDSREFQAQDQIVFQNAIEDTSLRPLNNINLFLEDEPFPTDQRDPQGRIVVTRQSAQAHLDSLAQGQS